MLCLGSRRRRQSGLKKSYNRNKKDKGLPSRQRNELAIRIGASYPSVCGNAFAFYPLTVSFVFHSFDKPAYFNSCTILLMMQYTRTSPMRRSLLTTRCDLFHGIAKLK